ncbi:MAG TPA: acylneuraminate cytidylyltransferase family protein [Solirubrobacteraceae bacterium]|jgi:CMP-N-acetylneuraminic acid synthetase|nr:acylneuraminate cytidylyltransferase family protein [Solirubrobacteraceae bacterium]
MIPRTASDNDPRIAAIVPMRHFSRRVPGKNYRLLLDKPLYRYILDTLLAVPAITEVVVDTDSDQIIGELEQRLPEVRIVRRPEHLRSEMLVMNDILPHIIEEVDADYYLQTHSTNPLLRPETIAEAIAAFLAQREVYDSLFSVTPRHVRLWTAEGEAVNHDPDNLIRTQDLESVMEENSCIYIFRREVFEARRNRIGARPLVFAMDPVESLDVDTELDWQIVEATLRAAEGSRA